ncbi:MAG: phosphatidylserine decarboxylase family protein [Bacteroidales bacterium]|nr:phosphatidylserine decarboxylase family protein [Bacteroidales bacterium]
MIRIHREGRVIVAITVLVLLVLVVLSVWFLPFQVNYLTSVTSLLILVLVLRFFRVPSRRPFLDEKTIVTPADGKVVAIERVHEDEYLNARCMQVSIFMSIHNVHINYFPINGKIDFLKYHPGQYLVARHPKSSSLNERYSVGIRTPYGPLFVRQVAGYVARRIRCYAIDQGQSIQGKEMGFIKFGSRLDLFIPLDAEIKVELNQKVIGSVTPVARFK